MSLSITLADGTVIDKTSGSVINTEPEVFVEVPSNTQIQRDIVSAKKRLHDLPLPTQQMNTVSVILVYTLMGVDEADIATVLHVDEQVVRSIKMSDVYTKVKQEFIDGIISNDEDNVRSMFADASKIAAKRMVEMVNSDSDAVAMAASKDVLDRAGHRPSDVIEHRMKVEGGLVIEVVEKTASNNIPIIDVTPNKELM